MDTISLKTKEKNMIRTCLTCDEQVSWLLWRSDLSLFMSQFLVLVLELILWGNLVTFQRVHGAIWCFMWSIRKSRMFFPCNNTLFSYCSIIVGVLCHINGLCWFIYCYFIGLNIFLKFWFWQNSVKSPISIDIFVVYFSSGTCTLF